jgi:hypothetical protein
MRVHVSRVQRDGRRVTLTVRLAAHSGDISVVAQKGRREERLRVKASSPTAVTFTTKLAPGSWTLTVTCEPASGFTVQKRDQRLQVTVPATHPTPSAEN